jgi:hypothetical protein
VTAVSEHLDSATWWQDIQDLTETPIRELIDGLDDIAEQAIPYGWLPGRARTFYGAQLATWSDLAGESISSLVNRPKGGIGTVRAIVIAAREAVSVARSATDDGVDAAAATLRLLDRLTDYDHIVLSARGWALNPQTVRVTANQLGVAPVNVQRNQPRADRRFRELLAEPSHVAVVDFAEQLRRRLGPLTRKHTAERALKDLGLDLATDAGQMLLHLAGPYSCKDTWLEDTAADGLATAIATLDAAVTRAGAPTTPALTVELGNLGIPPQAAIDFIESRPGLRRFGDRWVRWGPTFAERTEATLHLSGVPASAALIAATIGDSCHEKSVREVLYEDPRFTRATKQTWALRQWGIDEYTGVFSEIAARIDAAGGAISSKALVDDMTAAIPDVAESSVRSYLSAPGFVIENGMVRRRTEADSWPAVQPLNTVRGAFHNGRNEIRIALPVTFDVLRGSGQTLNPAVATALGIHPGQRRSFTGTLTDINLFWRQSATNGASVGSLRGPATTLGAQIGDTIVLAFNLRDNTVDVTRIPAEVDARRRVRMLLGRAVRNPLAALARALRCPPEDVAALLGRRGDKELLALVTESVP